MKSIKCIPMCTNIFLVLLKFYLYLCFVLWKRY